MKKRYHNRPLFRGILFGVGIAIGLGTVALLPIAVGTLNTFSSGTPVSSTKINENFLALKTAVESVTEVPTGTILAYGGVNPPTGWMICDGTAISRTTYANLYAVIGIHFGIGNGSSTFNLPDLRHRFLRGWDNLGTSTLDPDQTSRTAMNGGNSGTGIGSVQEDAFEQHNNRHNHTWTHSWGTGDRGDAYWPGASFYHSIGGVTDTFSTEDAPATSGRISNETRPKNVYVNFIIKY